MEITLFIQKIIFGWITGSERWSLLNCSCSEKLRAWALIRFSLAVEMKEQQVQDSDLSEISASHLLTHQSGAPQMSILCGQLTKNVGQKWKTSNRPIFHCYKYACTVNSLYKCAVILFFVYYYCLLLTCLTKLKPHICG